jgi:hypothetical protein
VELVRCRRQADQVEVHPPQERGPVGGRRGGETLLFVDSGHEGIDGIAYPGGVLDGRQRRPLGTLKRPVPARIIFGPFRGGALSALLNPPAQERDLCFGERLALGRHALAHLRSGDALQEQTLAGTPGHEGGAVLAAAADSRRRIQPQPALLFQHAMTGKATLLQNRFDVAQIIHRLLCRQRSSDHKHADGGDAPHETSSKARSDGRYPQMYQSLVEGVKQPVGHLAKK